MNSHYLIDLVCVLIGTGIVAFCILSWGQMTLRFLHAAKQPIQISHAWVGLATLISLCGLLQLFAPIAWQMSAAILIIAIANAYFYEKTHWHQFACDVRQSLKRHPLLSITSALGILFLSSGALLAPGNYDSGLYHFTMISWLNQYPITLGLGNLHGRLAFNQSYFPLLALINIYPLWNKGYSIAGPLFIYLGFAGVVFGGLEKIWLGAYIQASLLILVAFICTDISAPTPDLAICVLQIIIFSELIVLLWQKKQAIELGPTRLIAFACLCFLICSMKLSGAAFGLSAGALLLPSYFKTYKRHRTLAFRLTCLLLAFILIHISRSYLLSGTPFYPMALGSLTWADWAVPTQTIQAELDWTYSWARRPGFPIAEVLGNWNWLKPWLRALPISALICGLITGICFAWCLYWHMRNKKSLRANPIAEQSLGVSGLAFIPLIFATLIWFFTAPDIRFLGVIYQLLTILSLWFAMLMPHQSRHTYLLSIFGKQPHANIPNHRILFFGILGAVLVLINLQVVRPKIFTGSEALPITQLKSITTPSGLLIYSPAFGEQCGNAALPCTPYFNPALKQFYLYDWWLMYSVK